MNRRAFITLLGMAVARPFPARAQSSVGIRRVSILASGDRVDQNFDLPFRNRLGELGWREGSTVVVDVRYSAANMDRARTYASELVAMRPDVILATNTQMAQLLQSRTRDIPIVFIQVPDPV